VPPHETRIRAPGGASRVDLCACAHTGGKKKTMELVALTSDQSARIDALSDDCAIVGVKEGCPLVRQAGGDVALLASDGRLVRAEHGVRAVTPYLEVGAS
jgi:hypothetical protein